MNNFLKYSWCVLICVFGYWAEAAGDIPADRVLVPSELIDYLDIESNPELQKIYNLNKSGKKQEAQQQLANYLKQAFAKRFFFDWRNFAKRFAQYQTLYPNQKETHFRRGQEFLDTYAPRPPWKQPSGNLLGKSVTAYEFRHLARQHKAVDVMWMSHYKNDPALLDYFVQQVKSLNQAFNENKYERQEADGGNGVYEVFRAGYRMLNWLLIHQTYLSEEAYNWQDQLNVICAFLHHGAQLQAQSTEFHFGNHQTRGMSALAMLSILLQDFEGTDKWYQHSMQRLGEHLQQEINTDGFQFERSVHYHLTDIDNYFYVYQLAALNQFPVEKSWEHKLNQMFQTLVAIAYPDGTAPILQDDTDTPWAERNDISQAMVLGAILFDNPTYRYFAADKIDPFTYWFVTDNQLDKLKSGDTKAPDIGSLVLKETGYYIMRNGWDKDHSLYMIIDAGLEKDKPSHQHAGILGIEAYAYGNAVLPNYQVRYVLPDFQHFKSSFVKNMALADSIAQGGKWVPNSGGSGYGQWETLPQPAVLAWKTTPTFDYFAGLHDAYKKQGIDYQREVIFIKDGFWIVRDHFLATKPHHYQQIWQGHYSVEQNGKWLRTTFADGKGLDIIQLGNSENRLTFGNARGKGNAIFQAKSPDSLTFTTLLYPFRNFDERILDGVELDDFKFKTWQIVKKQSVAIAQKDWRSDASTVVFNEKNWLLLDASYFEKNGKRIAFSNVTSLFIQQTPEGLQITILSPKQATVVANNLTQNIIN